MSGLGKLLKGIVITTGIICITSSSYVAAQGILEEIVVTARKRSESLQDVPVTVTAFNADLVEQAGITSMRDYVGMTTNLTLVESQNTGFAFVNIRGLSTVRNVDPTVAVVVDGVLTTTSLGFSQDMYDIEQVEVLKGPQGALYGRNATGGAINITTRQPSNEVEAFVRAGYGNGDNKQIAGMISGPIVEDRLFGRFSASYQDAEGWRDNITLGTEHDPYENLNFAGKFLWNASDNVTVDLRFSHSETEAGGAGFTSNAPNFVNAAIPGSPAFVVPANGTAPVLPGVPAAIRNLVGDPNNTSRQVFANTLGLDDREITTVSGKIDWETDNGLTVTAVTSWDKLDAITIGDNFPYYPFAPQIEETQPPPLNGLARLNNTFGQNRFHEAFSQELRITSSDDQRLRWIAGGYFVSTELDTMIATNDDDGQGVVAQETAANIGTVNNTETWNNRFLAAAVPAFGALFGAVPAAIPAACQAGGGGTLAGINIPVCAALLANPNTNPTALAINFDQNDNIAYALFGQVNYDMTDNLELSFALRYDVDDREQTVGTPQAQLPTFPFASAFEGEVRTEKFTSLQPKATLRWQPSDDMTLYGTYAQGFRSGGFNLSGVSAGVAALAAAGVPGMPQGVRDKWDQEDTEGVEFGLKGSLAEGRFNYGGSIFYTELENAFAFTFVAQLTAQVIRNIDEAEVLGAEFNASWLPTDNLQIDVGFGILDSEINASSWVGAGGVNIVGNELPLNPETTLNVGVGYSHPLGNNFEGFLRFDYQRLGEMFFEVENFAPRDELDLLSLRAGISHIDGWELAFWSKNLTDENYIAEVTNPNGIIYYGKLRQYGVSLTKRF